MMDFETILIVDDEEDICSELTIFLSRSQFRVLTALNGRDALQLFQRYAPAVTVTDYSMPGMDGLQLLHEIKALTPQAEVIFISGHADMRTAVRAIQDHAFDFLSKPVDLDELLDRIRKALERARMGELQHTPSGSGAITHERYESPRDASVLYVLTPMDGVQRQRVMQEFQKLLEQDQLAPAVVISLGRCEQINNVGLNALLDMRKLLAERGQRVILAQVNSRVFAYLKTLGYHETFQITQSVENALRMF